MSHVWLWSLGYRDAWGNDCCRLMLHEDGSKLLRGQDLKGSMEEASVVALRIRNATILSPEPMTLEKAPIIP